MDEEGWTMEDVWIKMDGPRRIDGCVVTDDGWIMNGRLMDGCLMDG